MLGWVMSFRVVGWNNVFWMQEGQEFWGLEGRMLWTELSASNLYVKT